MTHLVARILNYADESSYKKQRRAMKNSLAGYRANELYIETICSSLQS